MGLKRTLDESGSTDKTRCLSGCSIGSEEDGAGDASARSEMLMLMAVCGVTAGLVAFFYDSALEALLWAVWDYVPGKLLAGAGPYAWLYTVGAAVALGTVAGAAIKLWGFPGDLPNVVHCLHERGFVPMSQTLPMIVCSLASIVAGGSLGPEAPLVAISSSCCGWISQRWLGHGPNTTRRMTLMGMSAGLSAFFGVVLGGALFALEVCHTMGVQHFESTVYCVGAGAICLVVFRGLQGAPFGAIWDFEAAAATIHPPTVTHVLQGIALGAFAAVLGAAFARLHACVGWAVRVAGFGSFEDTTKPVLLAASGAVVIGLLGVLLPPTMFWSELEMQAIAVPGTPLPHMWPSSGVWGSEPFAWDSPGMYALVGCAKLLAVSVTVHCGFRGGFIFPLFFAGASFGRALTYLPGLRGGALSPALACMAVAAGLNVSVTRTPFASALILTALCGVPEVAAPVLASALTALFLTPKQFIESQRDRRDITFVDDLAPLSMQEEAAAASENDGGGGSQGKRPNEAGWRWCSMAFCGLGAVKSLLGRCCCCCGAWRKGFAAVPSVTASEGEGETMEDNEGDIVAVEAGGAHFAPASINADVRRPKAATQAQTAGKAGATKARGIMSLHAAASCYGSTAAASGSRMRSTSEVGLLTLV